LGDKGPIVTSQCGGRPGSKGGDKSRGDTRDTETKTGNRRCRRKKRQKRVNPTKIFGGSYFYQGLEICGCAKLQDEGVAGEKTREDRGHKGKG